MVYNSLCLPQLARTVDGWSACEFELCCHQGIWHAAVRAAAAWLSALLGW